MEFRTRVDIKQSDWKIAPCEKMLFVGSCFADNIGRRFQEEKFRCVVNPYGVMYNPASILHTILKLQAPSSSESENQGKDNLKSFSPEVAVFTLGTNHVYILKETGEIVDNCRKRPQNLFVEKELSISECAGYLQQSVDILKRVNPDIKVIFTVSPIRYRKYGYHKSQLSKAVLQLAVEQVVNSRGSEGLGYFPAYEIVLDELRDYRFYKADMIHPSDQAIEYIYERFAETYFSKDTFEFLKEWKPVKEALNHKPFNPEAEEYKEFMNKTMQKVAALSKKYPTFAL